MDEPTSTNSPQNSAPTLQLDVERHCDEHGRYIAKSISAALTALAESMGVTPPEPKYTRCPVCVEHERSKREEDDRRNAARLRKHRLRAILDGAGIPPRYAAESFDTFEASTPEQSLTLGVARKYAANWPAMLRGGRSLIFTGGTGTGKTHLACAIASAIAEQHLAVPAFMPVTALLRHIKSTYGKNSDRTEKQAMADLVEIPDLLIVDEIGTSNGSDHEKTLLFEVLNERYQRLRPTILITNLSAAELEAYLGTRAMDRYRQCGSVIAFTWNSHRGAAAA